jgi:hypothetical protein
MNYRFLSTVVTLVVVLQIHISGTVVYQDDFSNAVSSYQNWVSSDEDFNKPSFVDGVCKIVNSSPTFTSHVSHKITLPSTFTYSCTSLRDNDKIKVGVAIYIGIANNSTTSFSVSLTDKYIYVLPPEATSATGISCPYLDAKVNKIAISRKGATYNVFINDKFATTFSDDKTRSGDIGFANSPNTTVSFDNVVVTDQFTDGSSPKCVLEQFNDPTLKLWEIMEKKSTYDVENGRLRLTTESNDGAYCFFVTDLKLTNFVARIEMSHINGSAQSIYGLRLYDSSYNRNASFVISGDRKFGSSLDTQSLSMVPSTSIHGKAAIIGDQVFTFIDTLEIVKRSNSANYYFVVNKDTLDTLTGIDFQIARLGFYSDEDLTLLVDNFAAGEGDSAYCPTSIIINKKHIPAISLQKHQPASTYDILGRNIRFMNIKSDFDNINHISSGVYINTASKKSIIQLK